MPRRALRALVSAVAAGALVAGCAQAHNDLGTASSDCYRAVPAAAREVGGGSLVGVRKANLDRLRRRLPPGTDLQDRRVCLVAYRGHYGEAHPLPHQVATRSGSYAIVAVDVRHGVVLSSFVTDHLPVRFRHL